MFLLHFSLDPISFHKEVVVHFALDKEKKRYKFGCKITTMCFHGLFMLGERWAEVAGKSFNSQTWLMQFSKA